MDVEIDVTAREHVPRWLAYAIPVTTIVAALTVSSLALVALGVDPLAAYSTMFVDTLTSEFGVVQVLEKATPLILTGLAVYIPLQAGLGNIGAEGQLLFGALAGTWVGLNVALPGALLVPLMFVVAAAAGALWAFVPAILRAHWNINEIITTLLFTFIAQNVRNYLLSGPMQGETANFPQTALLSAAATVPNISDTGIHAGILVAVAAVVLAYVALSRSRFGFEVTFVGSNPDAATYAGIDKRHVYVLVLIVGGALAGLAGISDISGVQGRFQNSYSPGYGFTAIVIALLGRNSALQVFVAALFFGVLFVGGTSMEVLMGVPAALVDVIQALVILFLITAEFFKRYRVGVRLERDPIRATVENGGVGE